MSERDEFEAPYVIDRSHPNQAYVTLGFSSVEACTQFIKATRYGHNDPTISPTRATPQQAMPEGWKLVPVEPTESMRLAPAKDRPGFSRNVAAEIYRSMLAAAPQPSQEPEKAPQRYQD